MDAAAAGFQKRVGRCCVVAAHSYSARVPAPATEIVAAQGFATAAAVAGGSGHTGQAAQLVAVCTYVALVAERTAVQGAGRVARAVQNVLEDVAFAVVAVAASDSEERIASAAHKTGGLVGPVARSAAAEAAAAVVAAALPAHLDTLAHKN